MLPDWHIQQLLAPSMTPVVFTPPSLAARYGEIEPSQVQPASLDVRLGNEFVDHVNGRRWSTVSGSGDYFELGPGECVLGCIIERFDMPDNLVARVEGKSSWARRFLKVHSAGFIDPGFKGDITLELKNEGQLNLLLAPGMVIAQISFQYLDAPARRPYGSEGLGSHYQGQIGANAARGN